MWNTNLERHTKTCGAQKCPVCCKKIHINLQEHIDQCSIRLYHCSKCGEAFNTGCRRTAHEKKCSFNGIIAERSAFGGAFQIIELEPCIKSPDYEVVLHSELDHVVDIVSEKRGRGIKFYMGVELSMERGEVNKIATFQTLPSIILQSTDIEEDIEQHINTILNEIEEYQGMDFGWIPEDIKKITLMITKYDPFNG